MPLFCRVSDPTLLLCVQPLPLWQKAGAGLTAGGLGALVGSPADLTLIRMQADATLPLENRRNYKGVGDAMVSESVDHPCAGSIGLCRAVNISNLAWGRPMWGRPTGLHPEEEADREKGALTACFSSARCSCFQVGVKEAQGRVLGCR